MNVSERLGCLDARLGALEWERERLMAFPEEHPLIFDALQKELREDPKAMERAICALCRKW